jgi:hypothetical protein
MNNAKNHKGAVIRASILLIFIIAAVVLVRFTPVKEFLTVEKLGLFFCRLPASGHLLPSSWSMPQGYACLSRPPC